MKSRKCSFKNVFSRGKEELFSSTSPCLSLSSRRFPTGMFLREAEPVISARQTMQSAGVSLPWHADPVLSSSSFSLMFLSILLPVYPPHLPLSLFSLRLGWKLGITKVFMPRTEHLSSDLRLKSQSVVPTSQAWDYQTACTCIWHARVSSLSKTSPTSQETQTICMTPSPLNTVSENRTHTYMRTCPWGEGAFIKQSGYANGDAA